MPYLKKVLFKQILFNTKRWDDLRVASVVSLRQIGTAEAMELIEKGLSIKRAPVKRMCNIVMELHKDGVEEPKEGTG